MNGEILVTDNLSLTHDGEGALLELTRPERLNALSAGMVEDLHRALDALAGRRDVRTVILAGRGRGFCAGLDLSEPFTAVAELDSVEGGLWVQERIATLVPKIRELPQPFIAAVGGAAAGGGLALALACDVRYAAPGARFNVAFVKLGLSGCDIGVSYMLPRLVGPGLARELRLTGRLVGADEALRIGLVNRIEAAEDLLDACRGLASEIAANTWYSVAMTKQVLDRNQDAPSLRAAIELENRTQVLGSHSASARERFTNWRKTVQQGR